MHGQKNEHKQYINLTLNDTDEVGDGGEDARGEARSPNRWAATSNTSSIQQTLGYDVAARSEAA